MTFSIQRGLAQQPNIVLILADDCSSVDIGAYGSPDSRTPTLDRLAKEGILFNNAYQSTPVCSPTRQNLLTGLSPFRSGAYPNHTEVRDTVKSLPHYLKPLGYRVALSGKRHFGPSQNYPIEYLGKLKNDADFASVDTFLNTVSNERQPFCLLVWSNEPHSPWNMGDTTLFDKQQLTLPPIYPDLTVTRQDFRDYLAEINYLDGQVKRTLELLDKHNLSDNTIVIFASEQGNSFPFAKWTCYNLGLRSALIARWPEKIKPNSVSNALVEYSDLLPTFIDIAGGTPVSALDGSSIVPILTGEKDIHKQYTFGQMTTRGVINGSDYYPIRSVSNGRYRYIRNLAPEVSFRNAAINSAHFKEWIEDAKSNSETAKLVNKYLQRPAEELYDDQEDPYNQFNLIDRPELETVKDELAAELKEWMDYNGDQGIITELLALEHMPNKRSGYPVLIDTVLYASQESQGIHINAPVDGYYTFYIKGPGSISVDGQAVLVAADGVKDKDKRYAVIGLQKGIHTVSFANTQEDRITYSGPSTSLGTLQRNQINKKLKQKPVGEE
ncbi:sulfatase family protein [Sphingobacterium corticibacterium]|nr:sulfatase [Sphingobacterium corticibacterium]